MSSDVPSPSKPPARRRFALRFSLRTFLIAVTLFCISLAWWLHRAKQQREAVQAITNAGGWVHYDYQVGDSRAVDIDPQARPWEPQWLLELVGIDFFHDVAEVNMVYSEDSGTRLDNKHPVNIAHHLAHFPRLRVLLLKEEGVDDAGMAYVGRLKRLESLYFWDAFKITDAGAKHLRDMPRLRFIHLSASQVGDEGLAAIATLPNLGGLSMQKNRITDAGVAHLAGHPKLRTLWIGSLDNVRSPISDAGVKHLATIANLEELDLQWTSVTPQGLKPLAKLKNLKSLMVSGSTADDYDAVAPLFPNCKVDGRKTPPPTTLPAASGGSAGPAPSPPAETGSGRGIQPMSETTPIPE